MSESGQQKRNATAFAESLISELRFQSASTSMSTVKNKAIVLCNTVKSMLRENYIRSTTIPSNYYDQILHKKYQSLIDKNSCPLSLLVFLSRRWYLALIFFTAVPSAILGACSACAYQDGWLYRTKTIRFALPNTWNQSANSTLLSYFDVGLLLDGCKLSQGSDGWHLAEGFAFLSYDSQQQFNGWYVTRYRGTGFETFPNRLVLEGSGDNLTWVPICAPAWVHTAWGELRLHTEQTFEAPTVPGQDAIFDMRASYAWLLGDVAAPLLTAAALTCSSIVGLLWRRADLSRFIITSFLAALSFVYFSASIAGLLMSDNEQYWFGAVWASLLLACLHYASLGIVHICIVFGAQLVAASLYRTLLVYGMRWPEIFYSDLLAQGIALIVVSAVVKIGRRHVIFFLVCLQNVSDSAESLSLLCH